MKVVLAGRTGALGRRVADDLAGRGDEVVVLTRSPRPGVAHRQATWDGATVGPWARELEGAALVNLAGELVDRRPTRAGVRLLTRSRVEPTTALSAAAAGAAAPPTVWVQMSTLAIYGDAGERILDETAPPAGGPRQMAGGRPGLGARRGGRHGRPPGRPAHGDRPGPRNPRPGSPRGAGALGPGRAGRHWAPVGQLAAHRRLPGDRPPRPGRPALSGVVHATSPQPVRNAELMAALRRRLHRPPAPPTPAVLVKVGAVLLRTDPALALLGRRAIPARLLETGFTFTHPTIDGALRDLLP